MLRKKKFWLILAAIPLVIILIIGLFLIVLLSDGSTPELAYFGLNWSTDGKEIVVLIGERTSNFQEIYQSKIYRIPITDDGNYRSSNITVAENVIPFFLEGMSRPVWSRDRSKIVAYAGYYDQIEIYTVDIGNGLVQQLTNDSYIDNNPDWSPDGTQIVFSSDRNSGQHLFLMNADGSNIEQLTLDDLFYDYPQWSPDGKQIAFVSDSRSEKNDSYKDSHWNISVIDLGTRKTHQLFDAANNQITQAWWSPDGSEIAFVTQAVRQENKITGDNIYVVSVADNRSYLIANLFYAFILDWTPNSRSIVFSMDGNSYQINVGSLQPEIKRFPIDERPVWSPDRSSIAFISTRNQQEIDVMFVDTQTWNERLLYTVKLEPEE